VIKCPAVDEDSAQAANPPGYAKRMQALSGQRVDVTLQKSSPRHVSQVFFTIIPARTVV